MHHKLPKEIDPLRLAQNGLKLDGQILLNTMPRLAGSLHHDDGLVDVGLAFDVDQIGTPYMKGEFNAEVSIICERCMSPMTMTLSVSCLLAMVVSERNIDSLAEQYDPWLLEDSDPVLLSKVVEDELILVLPLVPRHTRACLPSEAWSAMSEESEEDEGDKPESPFAILSSLKKK
jgi:uncharacterized protein